MKVGTILNNSIGCGCNVFWQVVAVSRSFVTVRRIRSKAVNVRPKHQTCDYVPCKDDWDDPYSIRDKAVKRLRYKTNKRGELQIGPSKRMIWWSVWDEKPAPQWSS